MRLRRGFTLIEMLCVISIIASLAALLFPVFTSAKGAAKRSVCLSNLSQIGRSITLYRNDHDDRYPYAIDSQLRTNADSRLPFLTAQEVARVPNVVVTLLPYSKTRETFACPMDGGVDRDAPTRIGSAYKTYGTSYSFSPILGAFDEAQTKDPTTVLIAHDMSDRWHSGTSANSFERFMNSLFADGHVHPLRLLSDHFDLPPSH